MLLDALEFLISHERSSMPKDSFEASAVQLRRLEITRLRLSLCAPAAGLADDIASNEISLYPIEREAKGT